MLSLQFIPVLTMCESNEKPIHHVGPPAPRGDQAWSDNKKTRDSHLTFNFARKIEIKNFIRPDDVN